MSVVVHVVRGAHVRNHDCPAVPAQGVFQYSRKLAVPVWDVTFLTLKQKGIMTLIEPLMGNAHRKGGTWLKDSYILRQYHLTTKKQD